jgi:hypothetical protein
MNRKVFICHSSKDYEKVSLVKEKLESLYLQPVVLFHASIGDNEDMDTVIKKNIDSSEFYVLCDSTNAKASYWVQAELKYITSQKAQYQTIDVDAPDINVEQSAERVGRMILDSLRKGESIKKDVNSEVWVFLSHSNKDYEKVRRIRNLLEDQSFRPLMFFLCCLDNDKEIDDLIKREIDHRTRFIYCESENAKASKWVQEEVKYIKSQDREFETINLDLPENEIKKKLLQLKKRASLFISYSAKDVALATAIWERLSKYDLFLPPLDDMSLVGTNYFEAIEYRISEAAENGFVLCLINDKYVRSEYALHEYNLALKYNHLSGKNRVIPALLSKELVDRAENDPTSEYVQFVPAYGEDQVDVIVDNVLRRMMAPGSILTYARNFKEGVGCNVDKEEAEKLFRLYYHLAKDGLEKSPTANIGMSLCYEYGYGVDIDYDKALEYLNDAISEGLSGIGHIIERVKKKREDNR